MLKSAEGSKIWLLNFYWTRHKSTWSWGPFRDLEKLKEWNKDPFKRHSQSKYHLIKHREG